MGMIPEIGNCVALKNLLVKWLGRATVPGPGFPQMLEHHHVLMLAADSTCQPCASSDAYCQLLIDTRPE